MAEISLLSTALVLVPTAAPCLTVEYAAHGGFRAGAVVERHPRTHEMDLFVPTDLSDRTTHIELVYGRSSSRRPDRGRVVADLEIARDTDGDGALDQSEKIRLIGEVVNNGRRFIVGPVAPLKKGDRVSLSARLRQMPRLEPGRRATITLYLRTE